MNIKLPALAVLICFLQCFTLQAQVDVAIGTGTAANTSTSLPCPLQDYAEGARAQYLYTAAELTAAGMKPGTITAIKYTVTGLGTFSGKIEELAVRMGSTNVTSLNPNTWEQVPAANLYGPADFVPVAGVNTIPLTTSFVWDGRSNLIVEICNGAAANASSVTSSGNPLVAWTTGLAFNGSHTYTASNAGNLCGALSTSSFGTTTSRPNIIFNYTEAAACSGTPNAGTAVSSVTTACPDASFLLSLSGAAVAPGLSYQWQNSVNNTTWANIPGATNAVYTAQQLTGTWYRCVVTCSNGGASAPSGSVQVGVPALISGTFTINSALATGGSNFQTFTEAYNYIRCGINGAVVFNVTPGSGPYKEQLLIGAIPGASAANTVTFNGNGATIQYSSTNTDERAVIRLNGADHIRFSNLVIDATSTGTGTFYGYGIHLMNDADSNSVRGCTIKSNLLTAYSGNYAGIVINSSLSAPTFTSSNGPTYCDSNSIVNNTIIGGYVSMTLVGSNTEAVVRNLIQGNTLKDFYNYGLYIAGSYLTVVGNNDISRPTLATPGEFYGIWASLLNTGILISGNRIHDPYSSAPASTSGFYAIYFSSTDAFAGAENKVVNNLVYRVNGQGPQYGIYNSGSDYAWYYHNTFSFDDAASTSASVTRAYYQTTQAIGIRFFNNIITLTRGGTGVKHAIYRNTPATTDSLNRNDYFINAPNSIIGFTNSVNYYTLATWKAGAQQDAETFGYNPLYKDTANGDYSPASLVLDARGAALGIATDISGTARSSATPDLGAFEFSLPPCNTNPVAGTALASPNSGVCLSGFIQLNLQGNTTGTGQAVQWQYAGATAGPWVNLGNALSYPDTSIGAAANLYYRAVLTCGGNSVTSVPVQVTVNPGLGAGLYTINPAAATSATNFQSFGAAVAVMECGIGGAVTFDVYPGTYTEQVRLHRIPGAGADSRVTFRSLSGDPASVVLTSGSATTLANYVLQLDSASYITFKNLSITGTNTTFARAVDIANLSSYDSIVNCTITVPVSASTANTSAGVFTNTLTGPKNVISRNRISGGTNGIYFAGVSGTLYGMDNTIEGNIVSGFYYYGIYASYNKRIRVADNTVTMAPPLSSFAYSIYANYCDTSYQLTGNAITISNTTGTAYGLYAYFCRGSQAEPGRIAGNTIQAITGITGNVYGLYEYFTGGNTTVNNVVNVKTTGATAYGINSGYGANINYWNNTVNNASAGTAATNAAAYFDHPSYSYGNISIRNNIFSHTGGGRALGMSGFGFINSDYNMLYTTGATLLSSTTPATTYATLADWQNASGWDVNSINYQPAFTSEEALTPAVASPDVWAMHGRGVQLTANNADINNNPRPTTLQAGVPDLGAYEFLPTSVPVALTASPAAPAAGTTQTFTLGSDVVARISWAAEAPVPASLTLRRYSGVQPAGLPASIPGMYYYIAADEVAAGSYNAAVEQRYVPSWLGYVPAYGYIKAGKTVASGTWTVNAQSVTDSVRNSITEAGVAYLSRFSGLTDGSKVISTPVITYNTFDSGNRGTEFWVPYGNTLPFKGSNNQELLLYLSAEKEAHVTVRVNGTAYEKTYIVPANTVVATQPLPKTGVNDARLPGEGLYNRGISIISDVPVAAYAAQYVPVGEVSNAATMLLPAGTYGYDYTSTNMVQRTFSSYDVNPAYSWINVIATHDSTVVQITPANPTAGGRAAGVPFTVTMMKGQVYQVLGAVINNDPAINSHDDSYDMSGTRVQSVANATGNCYPVAVFSGSSHTYMGCTTPVPLSGDNYIQQNLPSQAWGVRYLTAPASNTGNAASQMNHIYRVTVKDAATVVKRNGVTLTGLVLPGSYYQFQSNTADYIETDKPVTVAQLMLSNNACGNTGSDVEIIYLSALHQGITKAIVPRMMHSATTQQSITLIVPTAAVPSLLIDNSNTFEATYPHANMPGYTVVVKQWSTPVAGKAIITCDLPFTGVSYGTGSLNNYAFNVGMYINNQGVTTSISNTLNSTGTLTSAYTCARAPFRPTIQIPLMAEEITWKFSAVAAAKPAGDVVQSNPAPVSATVINGVTYYTYTLAQDCSIDSAGDYVIPVVVKHNSFEGCNKTLAFALHVQVKQAPVSDFTATPAAVCAGKPIAFDGTGTATGFVINRWNWTFSDGATATVQNTAHAFATAGTQKAMLRILSAEGCIGDTTKEVTIYALPLAELVSDNVSICPNTTGSLQIATPEADAVYRWYAQETGGTALATGTSYTITATGTYYAEATSVHGCISDPRTRAVVTIYEALPSPVVTVDSVGTNLVRFRWTQVAGAISYEVSLDGGATFITPSSGATGLTHTVSPLAPLAQTTIVVKANGAVICQTGVSTAVTGRTLPDQVFVPNAFTPNGDSRNDVWQVYGYSFRSMRVMVFNQWGGKVFEGSGQTISWDGNHSGKPQPSGVYMYVIELTMNDGTRQHKKGSINLIR